MYDRAPRKLTLSEDRTPAHLGPGTYPRHEINGACYGGDRHFLILLLTYMLLYFLLGFVHVACCWHLHNGDGVRHSCLSLWGGTGMRS